MTSEKYVRTLETIAERLEAWADGARIAEAAAGARRDYQAVEARRNERENYSALAALARNAIVVLQAVEADHR